LIVVFTAFTIAATAAVGGVAIAAIAVAIAIAAPAAITVAIEIKGIRSCSVRQYGAVVKCQSHKRLATVNRPV
jgi:hypothetical protein